MPFLGDGELEFGLIPSKCTTPLSKLVVLFEGFFFFFFLLVDFCLVVDVLSVPASGLFLTAAVVLMSVVVLPPAIATKSWVVFLGATDSGT